MLKGTGHTIDISRTDRSHRVGPTIHVKPRDIIVRFISYREPRLSQQKEPEILQQQPEQQQQSAQTCKRSANPH